MEDLVTWLRAQLDEDERDARGIHDRDCRAVLYVEGEPLDGPCDCGWPARVLREVEAKRRIAADHKREGDTCVGCWHTAEDYAWPCLTLRVLAAVFADRSGYQEEWKP